MKFFYLLVIFLFSGCSLTPPENSIETRGQAHLLGYEIQIISTTKKEKTGEIITKNGWGIVCGENIGYFPAHLLGEKTEYFFENSEEKIEKIVDIEIEKISQESDLVKFSLTKRTQNIMPLLSIVRATQWVAPTEVNIKKFSTIEIEGKKLIGDFFSLPEIFFLSKFGEKISQGNSGRGIFSQSGECLGMLIGVKNGEAIFVDISSPR